MAGLESTLLTSISGDTDLATSLPGGAVFGLADPRSSRPYAVIELVGDEAVFTTGDPYMWRPELVIRVVGSSRTSVKSALQDLEELFDKYSPVAIDEGSLTELAREGEYTITQEEDEPKTYVGELVYRIAITRTLQS